MCVIAGIIEIGTKNGTITTGIGVRGVVCPVDLPVRLKVCAVECSQMEEEEEGAVAPIRTTGGVVEIGKCSMGNYNKGAWNLGNSPVKKRLI